MSLPSIISWRLRCRWFLQDFGFAIQKFSWRIWHAGIKRRWNEIIHPRDEFHPSYDMDLLAIIAMNPSDMQAYRSDLLRRRMRAHSE